MPEKPWFIDGFMAQTGDGQNFNGTGGSKYPNLKQEFSNVPFKRGIVGMARRGDSVDSANSQFFIMYADGSFLNGKYTVVGEVVSGMDVVDKIKKGEPVVDPDKMVRVQVAADGERAGHVGLHRRAQGIGGEAAGGLRCLPVASVDLVELRCRSVDCLGKSRCTC